MKIKIGESGNLQLERKKNFKSVICPLFNGRPCGDWCALFRDETVDSGKIALITLCHREYDCAIEDFTDERK